MKKKIILAVLLPVFSAWAGDLSVDNLTVSNAVAVGGTISIGGSVTGTNGATATGGTITTNGGYIIHAFTNVGTTNFVVSGGSLNCDVLIVAGGGGGGCFGGGGGAGGLIYVSATTVVAGATTVVVGDGGDGDIFLQRPAGGTGTNGAISSFDTRTATGGGGGGSRKGAGGSYAGIPGNAGGSGGGGSCADTAPFGYGGSASPAGQGYAGGVGNTNARYSCGGGGGASEVGTDGGQGTGAGCNVAGPGGDGLAFSISGTNIYYAGGGGGGALSTGAEPGAGGLGGGGIGSISTDTGVTAGVGTNNTGGGGGGGGYGSHGGKGGSGIVIVRYPITTVTTLSISSNGISQTIASGSNVFMSKMGIGTNNPAEQLHVVGNARVDGTNIVSAITLGGETRSTWPAGNLSASSNLLDIADPAAARANLGLGSAATNEAGAFLSPNGDGSQITGITAAQVGALSTNAGALIAANNLSDVANASTSRSNLGLGSAATNNTSAFLSPAGNGSQLTDITAAQVGALSTNGGVVNGDISLVAPAGDIPMGVYTNQ